MRKRIITGLLLLTAVTGCQAADGKGEEPRTFRLPGHSWTTIEQAQIYPGVTLTRADMDHFKQKLYILEFDLHNRDLEVTTELADDLVPNPMPGAIQTNAREVLSRICQRKDDGDHMVLAGINTGFFDTNVGIPRGYSITEGRVDYSNNPDMNNKWNGITIYEDRSVAYGAKRFEGTMRIGEDDFPFYSINDTTLFRVSAYESNLYTSRNSSPDINRRALFVVARNLSPWNVNGGWMDARIEQVVDGRNTDVEVPYVETLDRWVLHLTGEAAEQVADKVSEGKAVRLRTSVSIEEGDNSKRIETHSTGMVRIIRRGTDTKPSNTDRHPRTFAGTNKEQTKMYWIVADGRSEESIGLKYSDMAAIGLNLDIWDLINFDNGGSTSMWVRGRGIVNIPSDKRERGCSNYFILRTKK